MLFLTIWLAWSLLFVGGNVKRYLQFLASLNLVFFFFWFWWGGEKILSYLLLGSTFYSHVVYTWLYMVWEYLSILWHKAFFPAWLNLMCLLFLFILLLLFSFFCSFSKTIAFEGEGFSIVCLCSILSNKGNDPFFFWCAAM